MSEEEKKPDDKPKKKTKKRVESHHFKGLKRTDPEKIKNSVKIGSKSTVAKLFRTVDTVKAKAFIQTGKIYGAKTMSSILGVDEDEESRKLLTSLRNAGLGYEKKSPTSIGYPAMEVIEFLDSVTLFQTNQEKASKGESFDWPQAGKFGAIDRYAGFESNPDFVE